MTKISDDMLKRMASLAKLGLSEAEQKRFVDQIDKILDFGERLASIETTGVVPTSQVSGLSDVTRADEIVPCPLSRDELLQNAPATERGYIKVKRVL